MPKTRRAGRKTQLRRLVRKFRESIAGRVVPYVKPPSVLGENKIVDEQIPNNQATLDTHTRATGPAMSVPLEPKYLEQLKMFIGLCMANPAILHLPELSFVKSFVEHFGGTVPQAKTDGSPDKKPENKAKTPEPEPEPESEESDLELDMTGVIEADTDSPQEMGNPTKEPTEEDIAESQSKRSEAVAAFAEKDYLRAIKLYTEAITLNPQAPLLYAKRGQVYLLLNKPNACIRDCNRALELNPDSAAALKFRGRAYHLIGKFEESANDLRLACRIDFDEQVNEWLNEVTPNARKIEEHKRKKQRKMQEKLGSGGKAKREGPSEPFKIWSFFTDPDVVEGSEDPEIKKALEEITQNPTNILKYQNNPKIMALINKIVSKFNLSELSNLANMMKGMGGSFPDAAGAQQSTPTPTPTPNPKPQDDVGLD